ncbi:MAG: phasin family protein [Betaproteobacteria bacterium]
MFKQASFNRNMVSANALAESAVFASRQAWLAGLGAASISREWARHEAGNTFRALVRKGSAVEKNAIQVIGGRVESSVATAASLWRIARATALATANRLAETASSALPSIRIPAFAATAAAPKPRKPAKNRAVKTRASRTVRSVKRAGRKSK